MGKVLKDNKIILLLDNFEQHSVDLYNSFKDSGYKCPTIVINSDGFLPDGVTGLYESFLNRKKKKVNPRYFDKIYTPDFWEIKADNTKGTVYYKGVEKGKIYYTRSYSAYKRYVSTVEWLDNNGKARICDHYNKYGDIYSRTFIDSKGNLFSRTYYSDNNADTIEENYVTGSIILSKGNEVKVFKSKTEFVMYYIEQNKYNNSAIYYNSLSTPFLVSQELAYKDSSNKCDILFWNEDITDSIPGNMNVILSTEDTRTGHIYVQKHSAYERMLELGVDNSMVSEKGYIYKFERANKYTNNAIICTTSDDIPKLDRIIDALPEINFNIVASTLMSDKLTKFGDRKNVNLYPCVSMDKFEELFKECDIYLDINNGEPLINSIRKAFLNNMAIFAYNETIHNKDYVAKEYRFNIENVDNIISSIKMYKSIGDPLYNNHINLQHKAALTEEKY